MSAEPIPDRQVPEPTTPIDETTAEPTPPAEPTTPVDQAAPVEAATPVETTDAAEPAGETPVAAQAVPALEGASETVSTAPAVESEATALTDTTAGERPIVAESPGVAETAAVAENPVTAATPVEVAVPAAVPPATTPSRRRAVAAAALGRLVAFVLTVALFVGGIGLGLQIFQLTHPPRAAVAGADVPGATQAPPVAKEFIAALGANDADGLRSSLDVQPHADLTSEFKRFDIQKVTGVETLGTSVDGTRSATEILVRSVKTDGLPFDVNLVILVNNGKIEGFR